MGSHNGWPLKACLQFWESIKTSDFLTHHPSMDPSLWAKTIPIGIHGDAGGIL